MKQRANLLLVIAIVAGVLGLAGAAGSAEGFASMLFVAFIVPSFGSFLSGLSLWAVADSLGSAGSPAAIPVHQGSGPVNGLRPVVVATV